MMRHLIIDIVTALSALAICGCSKGGSEEDCDSIYISCGQTVTRSELMDEDAIWDINLWVYSPDGTGEHHGYYQYEQARRGTFRQPLHLLFDREYEFFAIANAGYDIGFPSREELSAFRLHLSHPDGNARGMPMSARCVQKTSYGHTVTLDMERLMSRINVSVDRSELRNDVKFNVMSIRICNCPQSVTPFAPSSVKDEEDCFAAGYHREGSDKMQLYMLENVATRKELASYVEMEIDYESGYFHSSGKGLVYRFRIRENDGFAVNRNCRYNVKVIPKEDGLMCDDSWKVDKSGLFEWEKEPYILIDPEGTMVDGNFYSHYYEMEKYETRHFRIVRFPENLIVRLRQDLVNIEREEGRAIYTLDEDMGGFTVTALGRECLSSMEIEGAYPLNDFEMISIRVR